MKTLVKTTLSAALLSLLITLAPNSFAADYYDESYQDRESDMIADLVLARPLGVVGSAVGGALHFVGLLFSVPGENFDESAEVLVEAPLNYTFNRPLGHFPEDEGR